MTLLSLLASVRPNMENTQKLSWRTAKKGHPRPLVAGQRSGTQVPGQLPSNLTYGNLEKINFVMWKWPLLLPNLYIPLRFETI